MEPKRKPIPVTNATTGERLLYIPLANTDQRAIVLEQDYEALSAAGISPNWWLNTTYVFEGVGRVGARLGKIINKAMGQPLRQRSGLGYVKAKLPDGTDAAVARLIMRARTGEVVRYVSDDRLNLLRRNLYVVRSRHAKRDASQCLTSTLVTPTHERQAA